jgi:membrane-bound serine protease (ClpP class)
MPLLISILAVSLLTISVLDVKAQEAETSLRDTAVIVAIDRQIDDSVVRNFNKTIAELMEREVRVIIIELATPGGTIDASRKLADAIDNLTDEGIETFGWVPNGQAAYSGGTMVALACRNLVMGDNSRIGDVQPIDLFGNELPEKIQTTVRADMRRWARDRGYPVNLAEAMVTKEIAVLQVRSGNGRTLYLTEQELQDLPAADRESATIQRIVERGEILTIDEKEAFEYGFISHICLTQEQLLADYGLTQLRAISADQALGRQRIGTPGGFILDEFRDWPRFLKFLLILGAALALVVELKLPGVGIGSVLALGFLSLFLLCNYADGGVAWIELGLFGLGVGLVVLELFIIPGFGFAGILGLASICVALGLSLQSVDSPLSWQALSEDTLIVAGGLVAGLLALVVVSYFLPGKNVSEGSLFDKSTLANTNSAQASPGFPGLNLNVGQRGIALQNLRPSGTANFDNMPIDVVSEGSFIQADQDVEVIKIEGNRVIVRLVQEA